MCPGAEAAGGLFREGGVRSAAGEGRAGSRAQEEGSSAGAHGLCKGRMAESKSGERS